MTKKEKPKKTTRYVVYERHDEATEFSEVFEGSFTDLEDAEARFDELDRAHGHDTYHELVEVTRKVLRSH